MHLSKICGDVGGGHYSAARRIVLELVENQIDLIHEAVGSWMFDSHLIPVRLADSTVLIRPLIPDVGVQILDVVGFLLINPEYFI